MSNRTCFRTQLAGGLAAVVFLCATRSASALCIETVDAAHPLGCGVCCLCPCVCIPPGPWGYCEPQWRTWPGEQYRQDIIFPQSLGVERLATPRGTPPATLPKEVYGPWRRKIDMDAEAVPSLQIREGAPSVPVETPVPFELGPSVIDGPRN